MNTPTNDIGPEPAPSSGRGRGETERLLATSLQLTYIPVVVLVAAGLGAFTYASAVFVHSIFRVVEHPFPVGNKIGLFLLEIDLFLIGTTLLISAVGIYELFIQEIPNPRSVGLPAWLQMRDLNDLKTRVIAMAILVLAVNFVEVVVDSAHGVGVLEVGVGSAIVIVALTAFSWVTAQIRE
jgi:uncharacterized membrane protein YqhA